MDANWWEASGFTSERGNDIQALASGVEAPATRPAASGPGIRPGSRDPTISRGGARQRLAARVALPRHVDWFIEEEIEG
jgi:hypothetical protein